MTGRRAVAGRALRESLVQLTGSKAPGHRRAFLRDLLGRGTAAYEAHLIPADPAPRPGTLMVTWLGAAGLLLDDGTTRLLVDPVVSRPRGWRVGSGQPLGSDPEVVARWVERLGLGLGCAAVLLGHTHYDHALDAAAFARATGAVVVGSESAANITRGAGLPEARIQVVEPRDPLRFGAFEVRFLPSVHGPSPRGTIPYPGCIDAPLRAPAPAADWKHGQMYVLQIQHPQGSLLQQGSAAVGDDTLDGVRVDVAMPCLAWRRGTSELVDSTFRAVGARSLVPLHFDDMFRPLEMGFRPLPSVDLLGFFQDVQALGLADLVRCLPLGEPRPLMASGVVVG